MGVSAIRQLYSCGIQVETAPNPEGLREQARPQTAAGIFFARM
jgi:hypothetical protein